MANVLGMKTFLRILGKPTFFYGMMAAALGLSAAHGLLYGVGLQGTAAWIHLFPLDDVVLYYPESIKSDVHAGYLASDASAENLKVQLGYRLVSVEDAVWETAGDMQDIRPFGESVIGRNEMLACIPGWVDMAVPQKSRLPWVFMFCDDIGTAIEEDDPFVDLVTFLLDTDSLSRRETHLSMLSSIASVLYAFALAVLSYKPLTALDRIPAFRSTVRAHQEHEQPATGSP